MDIREALEAVRSLPPRAGVAREAALLRRDELAGSLAVAAIPLTRDQLDALAARGVAAGDQLLEHYLSARDLLTAAAWIAEQRPLDVADPRPLITMEDVRRLHVIATASRPELPSGVWRLGVEPAAGNVVSPPPWLIAKEMTALVYRFARRPAVEATPAWLADFLGRYARIRPFAAANGRAARLAAALLLKRLNMVPLSIAPDRAAAYRNAIVAAESGPAHALRAIVHDALMQSCRRLIAASAGESLVPLRALAGANYAALIKAAKRGRLAVVVRDGRVLTTPAWIDDYRASRNQTASDFSRG